MRLRRALVLAAPALPLSAADASPQSAVASNLEVVATSPHQWTGIGVAANGRIYVNFPRWSDDLPMSVGVLRDNGSMLPFPDAAWNSW